MMKTEAASIDVLYKDSTEEFFKLKVSKDDPKRDELTGREFVEMMQRRNKAASKDGFYKDSTEEFVKHKDSTTRDELTGRGFVNYLEDNVTIIEFTTLEDMMIYDRVAETFGHSCCSVFNEFSRPFNGFSDEECSTSNDCLKRFIKATNNISTIGCDDDGDKKDLSPHSKKRKVPSEKLLEFKKRRLETGGQMCEPHIIESCETNSATRVNFKTRLDPSLLTPTNVCPSSTMGLLNDIAHASSDGDVLTELEDSQACQGVAHASSGDDTLTALEDSQACVQHQDIAHASSGDDALTELEDSQACVQHQGIACASSVGDALTELEDSQACVQHQDCHIQRGEVSRPINMASIPYIFWCTSPSPECYNHKACANISPYFHLCLKLTIGRGKYLSNLAIRYLNQYNDSNVIDRLSATVAASAVSTSGSTIFVPLKDDFISSTDSDLLLTILHQSSVELPSDELPSKSQERVIIRRTDSQQRVTTSSTKTTIIVGEKLCVSECSVIMPSVEEVVTNEDGNPEVIDLTDSSRPAETIIDLTNEFSFPKEKRKKFSLNSTVSAKKRRSQNPVCSPAVEEMVPSEFIDLTKNPTPVNTMEEDNTPAPSDKPMSCQNSTVRSSKVRRSQNRLCCCSSVVKKVTSKVIDLTKSTTPVNAMEEDNTHTAPSDQIIDLTSNFGMVSYQNSTVSAKKGRFQNTVCSTSVKEMVTSEVIDLTKNPIPVDAMEEDDTHAAPSDQVIDLTSTFEIGCSQNSPPIAEGHGSKNPPSSPAVEGPDSIVNSQIIDSANCSISAEGMEEDDNNAAPSDQVIGLTDTFEIGCSQNSYPIAEGNGSQNSLSSPAVEEPVSVADENSQIIYSTTFAIPADSVEEDDIRAASSDQTTNFTDTFEIGCSQKSPPIVEGPGSENPMSNPAVEETVSAVNSQIIDSSNCSIPTDALEEVVSNVGASNQILVEKRYNLPIAPNHHLSAVSQELCVMTTDVPNLGYIKVAKFSSGEFVLNETFTARVYETFCDFEGLKKYLNLRFSRMCGARDCLQWILVTPGVVKLKKVLPINPKVWFHPHSYSLVHNNAKNKLILLPKPSRVKPWYSGYTSNPYLPSVQMEGKKLFGCVSSTQECLVSIPSLKSFTNKSNVLNSSSSHVLSLWNTGWNDRPVELNMDSQQTDNSSTVNSSPPGIVSHMSGQRDLGKPKTTTRYFDARLGVANNPVVVSPYSLKETQDPVSFVGERDQLPVGVTTNTVKSSEVCSPSSSPKKAIQDGGGPEKVMLKSRLPAATCHPIILHPVKRKTNIKPNPESPQRVVYLVSKPLNPVNSSPSSGAIATSSVLPTNKATEKYIKINLEQLRSKITDNSRQNRILLENGKFIPLVSVNNQGQITRLTASTVSYRQAITSSRKKINLM